MTPKRAMELADACTPYVCGSSNDGEVIYDAIRAAVNEALEEAKGVCVDFGAMYCHHAIDALKLPEEP